MAFQRCRCTHQTAPTKRKSMMQNGPVTALSVSTERSKVRHHLVVGGFGTRIMNASGARFHCELVTLAWTSAAAGKLTDTIASIARAGKQARWASRLLKRYVGTSA